MTLARVKQTGSGTVWWRLKIAGLAYEAVPTRAQESSVGGGLYRVAGLDVTGATLSEEVDMARAEIRLGSFTVRLKDTPSSLAYDILPWTAMFSRRPTARTWLTATCTDSDGTINVDSTDGFSSSGVFYIDQEAITYSGVTATTFTGCTRATYGTLAVYHYATDGAQQRAAEVTDWPVTIEGRRCYLYAYGDAEDPTGPGEQKWIGIVSRDAKLSDDATSWEVSIDPITRSWSQDWGGALDQDVPARGIYYPWSSCFTILLQQSATAKADDTATIVAVKVTGVSATQEDFVASVNAAIGSSSASGYGVVAVSDGTGGFHFELRTTGTAKFVSLSAFSAVDNWHLGNGGYALYLASTGEIDYTTISTGVAINTTYKYQQFPPHPSVNMLPSGIYRGVTHTNAVDSPGSVPRGSWCSHDGSMPVAALFPNLRTTATDSIPGNQNVLYVGGDVSTASMQSIMLDTGGGPPASGGSGAKLYAFVTAADSTTRALTLGQMTPGMQSMCFAGPRAPRISPVLNYGNPATLADLRTALYVASITGGSNGTSPLIDLADMGAAWVTEAQAAAAGRTLAQRAYIASRPVKLAEFLAEEAKLIGCYFALDANGRITIHRIGVAPTGTTITIDKSTDLTGVRLASWERFALGAINEMVVKTFYDPVQDQFLGPTYVFRNSGAFGRNPTKSSLTLAPKSGTSLPIGTWGIPPSVGEELLQTAWAVLGLLGYPYDIITITVPFTHLDVLCGDTVSISAAYLPDGAGARGMTSRTGFVVGRRWDIAEGHGELTVFCTELNYAGYTPSSRVASQTNISGNIWDLTFSTPAAGPTRGYSTAAIWSVNWRIKVVIWNDTATTNVAGVVTSNNGATVRVTLDGAWVPGASTWNLEFDVSDNCTADQLAYAFLANSANRITTLTGTTNARVLAP